MCSAGRAACGCRCFRQGFESAGHSITARGPWCARVIAGGEEVIVDHRLSDSPNMPEIRRDVSQAIDEVEALIENYVPAAYRLRGEGGIIMNTTICIIMIVSGILRYAARTIHLSADYDYRATIITSWRGSRTGVALLIKEPGGCWWHHDHRHYMRGARLIAMAQAEQYRSSFANQIDFFQTLTMTLHGLITIDIWSQK